jgi:hypothetical protein
MPVTIHCLPCILLFSAYLIMSGCSAVKSSTVEQMPSNPQLPDPFQRADGSRVASYDEWTAQRTWLAQLIQHNGYGTIPPAGGPVIAIDGPRSVPANIAGNEHTIALTCGPGRVLSLDVVLTVPNGVGPFPVMVVGDMCPKRLATPIIQAVIDRGYALAEFDRTRIARDEKTALLPLAKFFPGSDAGAIAAWAWSYHRVIDHLLTRAEIDAKKVIITGHSRGGKTVLLAGALDERIALVAPNNSGCMGAGCSRFTFDGETVERITRVFSHWFSQQLPTFGKNLDHLPFDQHTLKALIAPRLLLSTEGLGDAWANPRGTQITFQAAREVYRFLGTENNIGVVFRSGGHEHGLADFMVLLDFADLHLLGKAVTRSFNTLPFDPLTTPYFTWSAPTTK